MVHVLSTKNEYVGLLNIQRVQIPDTEYNFTQPMAISALYTEAVVRRCSAKKVFLAIS